MYVIIMSGFVAAGLAAGIRLMLGPTLADRIAALDVALVALMGAVATDAAERGDETHLRLLVVVSIVGFTATVAGARFVEEREVPG